jgi:large subunit ribosomal protein L6
MSKIARNPIPVPKDVTVEIKGQVVKAKGPKGELSATADDEIAVSLADEGGAKVIKLAMKNPGREARMKWGTSWSLIRNTIKGVQQGYTKSMEIQGVGLRANVQGKNLVLQLGFSHDITYPIPAGITITVDKQTKITVTGIDRQRVGQVAAEIRGYKPPEPYKGKGIRYDGEFVLRKEGKKK